jgi:hypothetical protein
MIPSSVGLVLNYGWAERGSGDDLFSLIAQFTSSSHPGLASFHKTKTNARPMGKTIDSMRIYFYGTEFISNSPTY